MNLISRYIDKINVSIRDFLGRPENVHIFSKLADTFNKLLILLFLGHSPTQVNSMITEEA